MLTDTLSTSCFTMLPPLPLRFHITDADDATPDAATPFSLRCCHYAADAMLICCVSLMPRPPCFIDAAVTPADGHFFRLLLFRCFFSAVDKFYAADTLMFRYAFFAAPRRCAIDDC